MGIWCLKPVTTHESHQVIFRHGEEHKRIINQAAAAEGWCKHHGTNALTHGSIRAEESQSEEQKQEIKSYEEGRDQCRNLYRLVLQIK